MGWNGAFSNRSFASPSFILLLVAETLRRARHLASPRGTECHIFCLGEAHWLVRLCVPTIEREGTLPAPPHLLHIGAHLSGIFDKPKQVLEINLTSAQATAGFPHFHFPETHLSFRLRA